ncbi:MAG: ArnT family glycosyltransferase [Planctomycetota bacterium]
MPRNKSRIWLVILFVGAIAIRMGLCEAKTGIGQALETGYREYVFAGERLAQHGTLVSPLILADADPTPSALLPPAYAGLVAVVYAALGAKTFAANLTLQVVNALGTSLAVVVVFFVTRRIAGERPAWFAAVLATINPTLFGYTHLIWDTSLFTLGVIVTVWFALRLSSQRAVGWNWFGYGVWLGGLALLNPALTVAYPFLVLWPLSRSHGWRFNPIVRGTVLSVIGWLIVITPWTIRNYHHFGELMYIRNGFMLELWLGVCPEADADGAAVYNNQFPLKNDEVQREVASIGERAFVEARGRWAMQAISDDPWRFVRLVAIRVVDYWAGTVFTHSPPGAGGWPRSSTRAAVTLFMLGEIVLLALCLGVNRKMSVDLRWLLATVISLSIVYCLTHVQIRFRAPGEPLTAIIVAVLATDTYRILRSSPELRRQAT